MADIVQMRMGYVPTTRGADGSQGPDGVVIGTPMVGIDGIDGAIGAVGPVGGTIGSVSNGATPADALYYDNAYNLISAVPPIGAAGINAPSAVDGISGNGMLVGDDITKWRYVDGGSFVVNSVYVGSAAVVKPGDVITGIGMIIRQLN